MKIDTKHFKEKLEEEKKVLEEELSQVGKINPNNPKDWEATAPDLNLLKADKNEMSDNFEEFENRAAVEIELEDRLKDINLALSKIEDGTYGKCEVDGKDIDNARLEANPAARTCIEHA
ncbi:MAG: TraR/DksA C4-type zinc finger protein [Parcubacteria group bacterium]|nr:TraR/DksA C4-type zinc finger protein [Parcubacteria group bacterium]MCR4342813.1 TraR/DksA C4-type zinc finger protein [Patescibacteria group bacterium]